jgi:hypothetical protein
MVNKNIRKRKYRIGFNNNEYIQYLQKDCINVLHVPVGNMPASKAETFLRNFVDNLKDLATDYKIIVMPKKG